MREQEGGEAEGRAKVPDYGRNQGDRKAQASKTVERTSAGGNAVEGIGSMGMGEGTECGTVAIQESRTAARTSPRSMAAQIGLDMFWGQEHISESRSSTESATKTKADGYGDCAGVCHQGNEVARGHSQMAHKQSVEETPNEYGSQLEQETGPATLEGIAAEIAAMHPGIKIRSTGRHSLLINAGKGQKWQVHLSKSGQLKLQIGGDKCQSPKSVDELVSLIQPSESSDDASAVNVRNLYRMLEQKQNFQCAMTGRELKPESVELDHIAPRSSKGEHTIENVHLVVADVNRAKGNMDIEDFIILCNDVARTHPRGCTSNGSLGP